ncbi:MAG TPA: hypothetical protein VNZ58_04305 [Thermomicrobiales bacterium]|nr:hypothetical protein [Thermomicrobiales bacterium]
MTRIPYSSLSRFVRLISLGFVVVTLVACTADNVTDSPASNEDHAASRQDDATSTSTSLTVGDLINRVDAAWPGVTSMRVTSMSGPVPTDSEAVATPDSRDTVTTEEWVAPDSRRIVERVGDMVTNEQIYANGIVYMRGMFVGTSVAPEVGTQTWVQVDPEVVPPDTPVGYRVAYISRDAGLPFGTITKDMRQRPAKESGSVKVGGRTCTVYTFTDSTQLGDRIDYELALDDNDLPCQIVQRAGGFQNSSVYEINQPDIQIIAPDAPTPVTGTPEG